MTDRGADAPSGSGCEPAASEGAVAGAQLRLDIVYEISALLARFDSAVRTLPEVFRLTSRTLPLRSAIVSGSPEESADTIVWQADVRPRRLQVVKARAREFTEYFGVARNDVVGDGGCETGADISAETRPEGDILAFPLALVDGTVFGTVVMECASPPSEGDVTFASVVANHVAIALDRAHRVATHDALTEARARQSVTARGDLLAIVSHDLKSPLGVISMVLGGLLKRPEVTERRVNERRNLETIRRATGRMTTLLDDLLDGASMEAGSFTISPVRAALAPLLTDALEAARHAATQKGVALDSQVEAGLPDVLADVPRIHQVLANLIGNAVKFTPPSGFVFVRVYRSTGPRGDFVTTAVGDSGPGIAEADRSHLFDRFWQARATSSQGTGLGLFIAHTIVTAHGGRIWAESTLGRGSEFLFELPAAVAGDDGSASGSDAR